MSLRLQILLLLEVLSLEARYYQLQFQNSYDSILDSYRYSYDLNDMKCRITKFDASCHVQHVITFSTMFSTI